MLGTKRFLLVNIQRDHGVMFHIVRRFLADVKLVKIKVTCAQARDQIRELVGEIRLVVTPRGYLAPDEGPVRGPGKTYSWWRVKNVVAGERYYRHFQPRCVLPCDKSSLF
jgi:hypothetical protein